MSGTIRILTAIAALQFGASATAAPPAGKNQEFDRVIAPLLAKRCLDCHSGSEPKGGLDLSRKATAQKGGESGKAFVPGNSAKSRLWRRIHDNEMPPKKPLRKAERELLKQWINAGANWGTDPIDPFRFTSDARAGYDWWSLQRVKRPRVPRINSSFRTNDSTPRNPIDSFILQKLKQQNLSPSPPANRLTLIRRLKFDLLGLPPTPDEIDAFRNDRSPNAYEKLADRYLASPQYGERWARHWLDIARFGESQGFERDKLRSNSWRYRDWLVAAFNRDMPYDEFARLQIAGDVLRPADARAVIATGFLVAGAWDEVGQSQQSAAMKAVVRQDELEDYVSTVGQAFLGLTIHCARCHDHKFDPIRQEEYYRLTAALGGVRHGERSIGNLSQRREADARKAAVQSRLELVKRQIAAIEDTARNRILAGRKRRTAKSVAPPSPLAAWDFRKSLDDLHGKLNAKLHGKATRDSTGLKLDGKAAYAATSALSKDLTEKTLEAWVRLDDLNQRGGGVIGVQTPDGTKFDAVVFGEREPGRWMAGSNNFHRTRSFNGTEERDAATKTVHVAVVWRKDGTIHGYRNAQRYGKPYASSGPVQYLAGNAQVVFGLRHSPPGSNKLLAARIERARLYDRALSEREIAASAGISGDYVSDEVLTASLNESDRHRRDNLRFEAEQLQSQLVRWSEMKAYAVAPKAPGKAYLLNRGNPGQQVRVVTPGGVASLSGVKAEFGLAADADDADRRAKLAEWITHPDNPLFARVIVNRLWHYHFGRGLVETPSDFGFNGGKPSHPELLEWLAAELRRNAWRLKPIHRLIVTSAAYRQSSRIADFGLRIADSRESSPNPQSAIRNPQSVNPQSVDAGNRFLWRMSPRRLEAEVVRDAMLQMAGRLNTTLGGPGFHDFTTHTRNSQFYNMRDPAGFTFHRRSLYRTWVRSGRNRFLDVFDCPDPSTKTPKRAVTMTPVQSLALLNNSFVLRMSDRFAERIRREAGEDVSKQVRRCWRIAYGRLPDDAELRRTVPFVKQHGLPALCRVVFNTNQFLFAD